jgi:hypothetical protein
LAAPVFLGDPSLRLLGILLFVRHIGNCNVCPFAGESDRDRAPDARIPAGDERASSNEFPRTDIAFFAVVRLRVRVGRRGRLGLGLGRKITLMSEFGRVNVRSHG